MKVYVSGKWEDRQYLYNLMRRLEEEGHYISYDWTTLEPRLSQVNLDTPSTLGATYMTKSAYRNVHGIEQADLVFVVMTDQKDPYQNSFAEIGCAIALKKMVLVYCPWPNAECQKGFFYYHPYIAHFTNLDRAIEHLQIKSRSYSVQDLTQQNSTPI